MSKSVRYSLRGSLAENTSAKKSGTGGLPLNGSKSPFATFWWRVDRRLVGSMGRRGTDEARDHHNKRIRALEGMVQERVEANQRAQQTARTRKAAARWQRMSGPR
jgi:hypothetical protein